MRKLFARIRQRLDAMPLWAVIGVNLAILGLWLIDFRIPDSIPIDKLLIGAVFGASSIYVWRRFFGPPSALAAETRRKLAEIELLYDETRTAASAIAGATAVSSEVQRLGSMLGRVRSLRLRLEQTEIVLQSPQYSESAAVSEVRRLEQAVASASDATRENLESALEEARKHQANIAKVRATRDEIGAAFERFYQIFRRIHSQVIGIGLAQGSASELGASVDELARALDEYEKEHAAQERAEAVLDKELADAADSTDAKIRRMRDAAEKKLH